MTDWRRLDPRMLVVAPARALVRLVPVLLVLLVTGRGDDPVRLWISAGITVLVVLAGIVRWRTTKYRITPERVELHSGWIRRQRRSVPRDRIRTVDLTATPLHRLFRLDVVVVHAAGTGVEHRHGGLELDAVAATEGEGLRAELLDRGAARPAEPSDEVELARLDWTWVRFAPLTFSALAGIGAVAAAAFNLAGELGLSPRRMAVDAVAARLSNAPLWLAIGIVGLALLALAVVGSVVIFVERWWGYRLLRENGRLHVRRGLLTTRSLTVAEDRLRGVGVHEPLLLRAGRGAQTRALSTGLGRNAQSGALQPPAPRAEAHRVAAAALARLHPGEAPDPTRATLHRHPRAALRRRLSRALVPVAVLVVATVVLGRVWPAWDWLWPTALVLLPLAALLAWDRYRALGHTLTPTYLVSRLGGFSRRTVAVQRTGIVGWRVRQSVFQRRAGLVTLEAVTAAGDGGYPILDVDPVTAVDLVEQTTPGLLSAAGSRTARA